MSTPARITAAHSFIHESVTTEVDSPIVLAVRTPYNNCRTILVAN